jgi:hypothetical protein
VALANGLKANLLRRWVVTEEQPKRVRPMETAHAALPRSSVENRTFILIGLESSAVTAAREITIELRVARRS